MDVTFDAEKHQYEIDGKKVPSVTQLVAPLGNPMDDLSDFEEITLDAAAERGTTMHAYLEFRLSGGEREDFELPSDYEDYADSVEQFLAEHDIFAFSIEKKLGGFYNGVWYAGTPDLVCEFDGMLSILDYKFVSSLSKTKVGAQLHGYRLLCEYNGLFPGDMYAVHFTRDGYALYKVGNETLEAFLTCLQLEQHKKMKHPRGGIA